jgi:hypothetical protein
LTKKHPDRVQVMRNSTGEIDAVLVGGFPAEILDGADKGVTASCDVEKVGETNLAEFPNDLVLQIYSADGLGTYLFHEAYLSAAGSYVQAEFVCHHPNKFWEGRWGLATLLGAIRDEVAHFPDFALGEVELEDDWKRLSLKTKLADGMIVSSLLEAASRIDEIVRTAEVALSGLRWKPEYEDNEPAFCTEVLAPLLRRMGFLSVRYLHGPQEHGKDFAFSELSPFGHLRHYGLQAKAGNVSGEVNSAVDELLGQANDAFAMPYYDLGSRDPCFISTFIIAISGRFTWNAKEKIISKLPPGMPGSVFFLDRERILELVDRHWRKK